jgi:hypothetical protein
LKWFTVNEPDHSEPLLEQAKAHRLSRVKAQCTRVAALDGRDSKMLDECIRLLDDDLKRWRQVNGDEGYDKD